MKKYLTLLLLFSAFICRAQITPAMDTTAGRYASTPYVNAKLMGYLPVQTVHNGVSRSLNSGYTISTTQQVTAIYTIRIAYTVTALLGTTGSISLQYSTNGGSTYITVSTISNNINLGVVLTGYNDYNLYGVIPANALVKLTSTTTNATDTYQTGTEIY